MYIYIVYGQNIYYFFMKEKQRIPLATPEIRYPVDNPSYVYRAETQSRSWGEKAVIEPLPFYPHAMEFCRHFGKWWCLDEKNRYALVVCVPEGRLRYRLDGKSVIISGTDVLIIPRGVRYYFETVGDEVYQKDVLYLLGVNIDEILDTLGLKSMQPIHLPSLDHLRENFKALYDIIGNKNPQSMSQAVGIAFSILNYLAMYAVEKENTPALLNVLKSRFSNDFSNRIDLESAAKEYGISTKTISRMFKYHLGVTPGEFRRTARNAAACRLLKTTNLSVKEIADQLGYSNQFHFSSVFKKENGKSPVQYRKEPVSQ